MKKLKLFFLATLSLAIFSCENTNLNSITVAELETIIKRDSTVQILDVRTSIEQKEGTILDAKRVNLLSNNFVTKSVKVLNKLEPVYVYCRSGRRSEVACEILLEKGYDVYNVTGGFKAWSNSKE